MRICFLGDIRSVHVQKFIKWFAKDHETFLISFDYPGDPRSESGFKFFQAINTRIYLLHKSIIPLSPIITRNIIHKISPDIVQCHFITNYGFLGAFSGFHPIVMSAMGDDILIHPGKFPLNYLVGYALSKADMVTYDGYNSLEVLKQLGVPAENRLLLYPGVDINYFKPIPRPTNPFKVVFYPRGFDKIYDVDTLFEVIKIVCRTLPGTRFVLMGRGTEMERFEDKVRVDKLTKWVTYLGDVPNELVPQYLAEADVSITTSLSDGGIPTSTVEAMACGIPVISTDAGDARIWLESMACLIEGFERGCVVEKQNPAMMSEKIIMLLTDEEKRLRFGQSAHSFATLHCNYTNEMSKAEKLYTRLISGGA